MLVLAHVSSASQNWIDVDLTALAQEVLAVQCDIPPCLLAKGDPRLLHQALENLLGNAWKFSSHEVQARISFGLEAGPNGQPAYVVRDNGAGFDMAYADKLFGAFQRLHSGAEFPGTGIGLATVQRTITRHGGRIWGDAVVGEGANFYFTLGSKAIV